MKTSSSEGRETLTERIGTENSANRRERVCERGDGRAVVGGVDLHPVLAHAGLQRLGRVDRHDLAVIDDRDAVAVLGLVHVVGGQEDRNILAALQVVDVVPDRRPGLRVQANRRLVEEQHVRRVQQAAGDLQSPLHTARVGADQAVLAVPQAHHVHDLPHPGRHGRAGHPVELGMEAQVLLGGQVSVQGGVLEDQPDVAADRVALGRGIVAGHARGARRSVRERAEDLDRRGLARAVGPEEAESLSPGHLEVNAAYGLDLSVLLGQAGDVYHPLRPAAVPATLVACRGAAYRGAACASRPPPHSPFTCPLHCAATVAASLVLSPSETRRDQCRPARWLRRRRRPRHRRRGSGTGPCARL
jgi:hypothetical protein